MTNSEARKRHQTAQAPVSRPNTAPVDSGAIGRLNEAERLDLRERIAEAIFADEYGAYSATAHPDHNRWTWQGDGHSEAHKDNFRRMAICALVAVEDVLPDLVRERLERAWDEGKRATWAAFGAPFAWAAPDNPYRAAREEQNR